MTTVGRMFGVFRGPVAVSVARRLALSVPLLFVVSILLFVLISFVPGDPAEGILGPRGLSSATPAQYDEVNRQLGAYDPVYERYWNWLTDAVHGDLGTSVQQNTLGQDVTQVIAQRFPTTLSLVLGALLISLVVGVCLGVASAVWGGRLGRAVDAFSVVGFVVPGYLWAALLIVVFAVKVRWFPATGYVPFSESPVEWLRSLTLPVIALAALPIGMFAKYTRDGMLDALASEHVRMARANGVRWRSIVFVNALKPASLQVATLAGLIAVGLMSSAVFVETVFGLPGLGSTIVNGAIQHDVPVVQGIAVVFTLIVIVVNIAIDVIYGLLSPKVKAL
jgi:peptide/nickel transport system permease protein